MHLDIDPNKVYLVKGSTLARLQREIRSRTPIPSDSQQSYRGPLGFSIPRGTSIGSERPFEVESRGGEVFVRPGLISVSNWNGIPFVPLAQRGGLPLDTLPQPSCGPVSATQITHVHLTFDCELIGNPIEGYFEGGRVHGCHVELAVVLLDHRDPQAGPNGLRWWLRVPIGRVAPRGGQVVSLLNTNLNAYFMGPYTPFGNDVEGRYIGTAPTLALFQAVGPTSSL